MLEVNTTYKKDRPEIDVHELLDGAVENQI